MGIDRSISTSGPIAPAASDDAHVATAIAKPSVIPTATPTTASPVVRQVSPAYAPGWPTMSDTTSLGRGRTMLLNPVNPSHNCQAATTASTAHHRLTALLSERNHQGATDVAAGGATTPSVSRLTTGIVRTSSSVIATTTSSTGSRPSGPAA